MGPCMLEVSRGTAYGLALSQMALALGAVLFFPPVHVQIFTPSVRVVNGTLDDSGGSAPAQLNVAVAGPFLLLSSLTLWFSGVTMNLHEQGSLSSDYTNESLENASFWDFM